MARVGAVSHPSILKTRELNLIGTQTCTLMKQVSTFGATFFLVILLAGCQKEAQTTSTQAQTYSLLTFSKNSVAVAVHLEVETPESAQLIAIFTPTEPTLHLYGLDMPLSGIDGVGRPTRVAIVSGVMAAAGELQADVTATDVSFPTFAQPFPLYPDGPVTLTLPVTLPASRPESPEAVLSITYMACSSEGVCKPPVTDKQTTVTLPAAIWQ